MFKTLKNALVAAVPVSLVTLPAFAAANLKEGDYVGISLVDFYSFCCYSILWLEIGRVSAKWRTSLVVSGLLPW